MSNETLSTQDLEDLEYDLKRCIKGADIGPIYLNELPVEFTKILLMEVINRLYIRS